MIATSVLFTALALNDGLFEIRTTLPSHDNRCISLQVNNIYHHESLGVEINVVVTKIMFITDTLVSLRF